MQTRLTACEASLGESRRLSTLVSEEGYGRTTWGSTQAEVERAYPKGRKDASGKWLVIGDVAGLAAATGFVFTRGKLTLAVVVFAERHANNNKHIEDYLSIKDLLTKKYGGPTVDRIVWSNDLYREDTSHWGTALAMGHLAYYAAWETSKTKVQLVLTGDNFEVSHGIRYSSKELEALQNEASEQEKLDNL